MTVGVLHWEGRMYAFSTVHTALGGGDARQHLEDQELLCSEF